MNIKFSILFLFLLSSFALKSQCDIQGLLVLDEGTSASYQIPPSPNAQYFWSIMGNAQLNSGNTGPFVQLEALDPGTATLCVTKFSPGKEPCCNCVVIQINEVIDCIPANSISMRQIIVPGNGCPGDDIDFEASVLPDNASPGTYTWEAGTGFIPDSNNIFFTATGQEVTVPTPANNFQVWVRVTFTSCDGSTVSTFSLVEWEYPCKNPPLNLNVNSYRTNDKEAVLHISSEVEYKAVLEIYTITGQLIRTENINIINGKQEIPIHLNQGMTIGIYRIITSEETLYSGKF